MDPKIEKQIQDFADLIAGIEAVMKDGYFMRANIHIHIHVDGKPTSTVISDID